MRHTARHLLAAAIACIAVASAANAQTYSPYGQYYAQPTDPSLGLTGAYPSGTVPGYSPAMANSIASVQNQTWGTLSSMLPGVVGAAAGGLLGYRFGGMVGALVGAVGGYLVGQFVGNQFLGQGQGNFASSTYDPTMAQTSGFLQPGQLGASLGVPGLGAMPDPYGSASATIPATWNADPYGSVAYGYPAPAGGTTATTSAATPMAPVSTTDLASARSVYFAALVAYQNALASGDTTQAQSARAAFDAARATYVGAVSAASAGR